MFSGIITAVEKPLKVERDTGGMRLTLPVPKNWKVKEGDSISVDGVCLTAEKISKRQFSIFLMPETLRRTSFADLDLDHAINLEQCLTLNTLIGGHLVQGHVDTTATIEKITVDGESKVLTFQIDPEFTKYMIFKGSIAVNGVSLTLVSVTKNSFTVSLIPYTLSHTNLGILSTGDRVNVEVDMISKYIEKLLGK